MAVLHTLSLKTSKKKVTEKTTYFAGKKYQDKKRKTLVVVSASWIKVTESYIVHYFIMPPNKYV